jgi:putative nucleotidyltransferase with HDIG domain
MAKEFDRSHDLSYVTSATVAADIARVAPMSEGASNPAATLLLTALARHDGYTYLHSLSVSHRAWEIAIALGRTSEHARQIGLAGLLHDIGKMNVPRSILTKPAMLTSAELAMVHWHPQAGAQLIQQYADLAALAPIVGAQYERPDGLGYPYGLRLEDIPQGALILAVADAIEAMASQRPYARPMSAEDIREELLAHAGACWGYAAALIAVQYVSTSGQQRSSWTAPQRFVEPRPAVFAER